jgi:serine/threonine-protein kinase
VVSAIGAGGMGEVYRATDNNLKRSVAIKVLPGSVAGDAERLARFQREAELLATLNHPNLAAIYGLEKTPDFTALVMELIDGDDLSQRIARGAIPLDEALPIARQIAEALEAAHEQGIIHRDLKPANIKLRTDGTVKVLDFGLAKAMEPVGTASNVSQSPTITTPAMMTGAGVILGTAAYMAPEQARGKTVDKRADIWAFGCVLYEMLTGTRAFAGDDVSEVLASVLAREPDWARLPPSLSPALGTYIRRCLYKNPKQRIADAQDIRLALEGAFETAIAQAGAAVAVPVWRRGALASAAALLSGAVVATLMWFAMRPQEPAPPRVVRLPIAFSPATTLTVSGFDRDLAITPDGSRLIYVGNNGTQLFVRALDALEPVAVFTGAPRGPFVSLDGRWIGFVDGIKLLKKVAVTGGPAVTLAMLDYPIAGATWGADDAIIVTSVQSANGLRRVAAGGPTTVLTRPDRAAGELDHVWPELLPGGRAVLFTITALTGGPDAAQVVVLDLQTGKRTVLVRGGSQAHYVSSGHLVYVAAGTLRAVAFDLARLETHGTPVPVVPDVVTTRLGSADAVVAGDGTLAYVSGGVVGLGAPRTLVWVDRQGRETPIPAPPRAYVFPRLSPDGRRIAVYAQDQEPGNLLWDLDRRTLIPTG